jgi:hypothetical protein
MDPKQLKEKVAGLLLKELRTNPPDEWYYISLVHRPSNTFVGGYLLLAKGWTDAWCKMHYLNWCPPDCESRTYGPLDRDKVDKLPDGFKWRKLTKDEAENLGT